MISIIIPTYNAETYVKRCVTHLADIRMEGLEVVFVDGGSRDGTVDFLKGLADERFQVLCREGCGIYEAMNLGVGVARNDLLYFMGADDIPLASFFNGPPDRFSQGYDLYVGKVAVASEGGEVRIHGYVEPRLFRRISRGRYATPHHQAVIYHKSYFAKVGLFNEKLKICSDAEHLLRSRRRPDIRIAYLDEVLCRFRAGGTSSDFLRVWGENMVIYAEIGDRSPVARSIYFVDSVLTAFRFLLG